MQIMSTNTHSLRLVTVVISVILISSTIGLSTGDQAKFDSSRDVTYLSVVPSSQTVGYGETFSIIVHLDPGEPIIGVQIDLSFTPSLIQVVSVSSADPVWSFFPPSIDNIAGEIHGAGVAVFGTTINTPTDCFNITFTAQSTDGTSPLTLHDVIVTDQNAKPVTSLIIANGEVTVGFPSNLPPLKPKQPWGPTTGKHGTDYTYNTTTSDPNGDQVYYMWDWGDGSQSSWIGPYASGVTTQATHTWANKGSFKIKVKAKDVEGLESEWSESLPIQMPKNSTYLHRLPLLFFTQLFERFFHAFLMIRQRLTS